MKREGVARAVIFLRTGSGTMDSRDLTRNGIRFDDDPVLYVLDLVKRLNQQVLDNYPDRTPFYFVYDEAKRRGTLLREP